MKLFNESLELKKKLGRTHVVLRTFLQIMYEILFIRMHKALW